MINQLINWFRDCHKLRQTFDFKDFMKIYKKCTAEYSSLVNDTPLPSASDSPLQFGKNLSKIIYNKSDNW